MVAKMAAIVRASASNPIVRETAVSIVRHLPARAYIEDARAIRQWMQAYTVFLRDPVGVEVSYTPEAMIRGVREHGVIRIDCDDAAVLAASLGRSIGLREKFVLVAFMRPDAPFAHVWAELAPPGTEQWQEMDTTRSQRELPANLISRRFEVAL